MICKADGGNKNMNSRRFKDIYFQGISRSV